MNHTFSRSPTLNNLPTKKLQEKLVSVVKACSECSLKELSLDGNFDGLCQKCSVQHIAYNRYYESNIPIDYWELRMEKDFSGFAGLMEKYQELTKDIRATYLNGTSICFSGNHGVGKTMTTTCVLKKAVQKGFTALYTTLSDAVNVLVQSEDKFTARRELVMVDFLALDEFDPRFLPSATAADLYARTLESIFRTRSQNKLPTLMCSNSPNVIESFAGPLKESVQSLMNGYLKIYPIIGEDYRKSK
jgi:DNA replication protein DnaC